MIMIQVDVTVGLAVGEIKICFNIAEGVSDLTRPTFRLTVWCECGLCGFLM